MSSSRAPFVAAVTPKSHTARARPVFALRSALVVPRQVAFWLAALAGALVACTRVEVAGPSAPPSLDGGGEAGQPGGGAGPSASGAGDGGSDDPMSSSGAPAALELGLWPTYTMDPERARDVQEVSASIAALSAGSTTLPLYERWDDLAGASGAPLVTTWSRLDAMIRPYRERRGQVAFCIGIVDRREAAWPFAGGLDTAAALVAMQRTIDEVFSRYGGALSHLCFGYELDRYLERAPSAERRALLGFVQQAIGYARAHPMRSPRTAIGTAVTLGALQDDGAVPLEDLLQGDELVAVYDPLTDGGELKAPASVTEELNGARESLARRLPLSLFEIGYPSAADAGSSEADQLAFYDALFGVLEEARDEVGFVGVYGLADRARADCDAELAAFGISNGASDPSSAGKRATVRCSMGLRAGAANATRDKLAEARVLAEIARYR